MPEPLSEEKKHAIELMIEDGASKREIIRSIPVHFTMLDKYFPDYRGWTPEESGSYANLRRQENRIHDNLYS